MEKSHGRPEQLTLPTQVTIDYKSAEHLRDAVEGEIKGALAESAGQLTEKVRGEIIVLMERRNLQVEFNGATIIVTDGNDKDDPGAMWRQ